METSVFKTVFMDQFNNFFDQLKETVSLKPDFDGLSNQSAASLGSWLQCVASRTVFEPVGLASSHSCRPALPWGHLGLLGRLDLEPISKEHSQLVKDHFLSLLEPNNSGFKFSNDILVQGLALLVGSQEHIVR